MAISSFVFAALLVVATARPIYRTRLPNQAEFKAQGICDELGHVGCQRGNNTVNDFGRDFRSAGRQYTREFCEMDSDGDGWTNGAELGDPCCTFVTNKQVGRTTDLSHPGERDSTPENAPKNCTSSEPPQPTDSAEDTTEDNTNDSTSGSTTNPSPVTPTGTPTIEPSQPASSDPVCFPALAQVTLADGSRISMERLQVGDRVAIGNGAFSRVFMFTHALKDGIRDFVSLQTRSGASITLTAGHFLYANSRLVRADTVRDGDVLELEDGRTERVSGVREVRARGLYNPQTEHGDIIVDGVRASTYTHTIDSRAAHAALAPLRMMFAKLGWYTRALDNGVEQYISM